MATPAKIEPHPVTATASVAALRLEALNAMVHVGPSPFWLFWAQIAIDNEATALKTRKGNRSKDAQAIIEETKAAMIALTAAACAIDTFCLNFEPPQGKPKQSPRPTGKTCSTKRERRPKRSGVIWSQLGQMTQERDKRWERELVWLFDEGRNRAVHYRAHDMANKLHGTGSQVSAEIADFAVESCTRAVDVLTEILKACTARPKPALADAVKPIAAQVRALSRPKPR
jgi:hypothetical protein